MTGAAHFCAIRTYLATAAKHGITALHALTQAASGHAWIPHTSQPSRPGTWAVNLDARLAHHATGRGARLLAVLRKRASAGRWPAPGPAPPGTGNGS
jgi:hypothetical protein